MLTYENDIEWDRPFRLHDSRCSWRRVKEVIWDDQVFEDWVDDVGLVKALWAVSSLRRSVGMNMKRTTLEGKPIHQPALALTARLRSRRQALRREIREVFPDGENHIRGINNKVDRQVGTIEQVIDEYEESK